MCFESLPRCERPSFVARGIPRPTLQQRRSITTYASLQKRQRSTCIAAMEALASRRANRDVSHVRFG